MPTKLSSYRYHKATGQAVVTLNGKALYLGPHGTTESRAAYDRLISEWLSHGRYLPGRILIGDLSVAERCAAYLDFAESYYCRDGAPTSKYVAMRDVAKAIRLLYAVIPVGDFGPLALKAVRQTWVERGLARLSIKQRLNRARRIFHWGVE